MCSGGNLLENQKVLNVGTPYVNNRKLFQGFLDEIFYSNWLTNDGIFVKRFENWISEFLGVKHTIAVTNATVGLQIVLKALEIRKEVIVPAFTFIATPHAVRWIGLKERFVDVEWETHHVNTWDLETILIKDRKKIGAIIPVNIWGEMCEIEEIEKLSCVFGIPIIYDSAHSFGCTYKGKMSGGFGNAEVFSFHATKFIHSFEGGIISTNDDKLAKKIKSMRNFGFSGFYKVGGEGINGKMTEVCAAMGLSNVIGIYDTRRKNRENYEMYKERLSQLSGIDMYNFNENELRNYQYVVILINDKFGINRDSLMKRLEKSKVNTRRYFYPGCHRCDPYLKEKISFPITESLSERVLCLPTGPTITEFDIDRICGVIEKCQK